VTDFWHATEYLASASEAIFSKRKEAELKGFANKELSEEKAGKLNKTTTYFTKQKPRMKYSDLVARKLPIGFAFA